MPGCGNSFSIRQGFWISGVAAITKLIGLLICVELLI
jgi:hypothetical protein